jgi:hypothetical protein
MLYRVYCYDKRDPTEVLLSKHELFHSQAPTGPTVQTEWQQTRSNAIYLAHEPMTNYEASRLNWNAAYRIGMTKLHTEREFYAQRVIDLGGTLPKGHPMHGCPPTPKVVAAPVQALTADGKIIDHLTGRAKPPPKLPHEVWNPQPVNADAAMDIVRQMSKGEAGSRRD